MSVLQPPPALPQRDGAPPSPSPALRARRLLRRHGGDVALLLPFLAVFGVFVLWPVLRSAWLSFTEYHATLPPRWVGLENYEALFTDERFWRALRNTAVYTVSVTTLAVSLGLVLALAFGSQSPLHQLVRIAFFLPSVAGGVGAISAWKWLANSEPYGLLNSLRGMLGLEPVRFLADPAWSMPILVALGVWSVLGYNMILFVAAMRGVPAELHEAATLDGATRWQRLRHITLPMLRPTFVYAAITAMVGSFQVFYEPYLLFGTNDSIGGPLDSALTLVTYLYDYGFQQLELGYASAVAWVLTTILVVVAAVGMRLSRASQVP